MSDSSAVLRQRVIFRGRVQGVGFRATTASIARRHPVVGYVKNMPDGAVELIAEAEIFFAHLDQSRSTLLFGDDNFVFTGVLKDLIATAKTKPK